MTTDHSDTAAPADPPPPPPASEPDALGPPDEATSDAMAELSKIDDDLASSAAAFDPEAGLATPPPSDAASPPPAAHAPPPIDIATVRRLEHGYDDDAPIAPKALTIEDLYARYPDLGEGGKILRIERRKPEKWFNTPIAGFLCDVKTAQIGMEEIRMRFGGGEYELFVLAPGRGTGSTGGPRVRTVDSLRIRIPGQPVVDDINTGPVNRRSSEVSSMMGGWPSGGSGGRSRSTSDEVDLARLKFEQERLAKLEDRAHSSTGIDSSTLDRIQRAGDRRAEEVREQFREQLDQERQQCAELRERVRELEDELRDAQREVVQGDARRSSEVKDAEDRTRREMESNHDREVDRLRREHDDERRRLREEHEREIRMREEQYQSRADDMRRNHDDLRDRIEREAKQERDRAAEMRDRESRAEGERHREQISSLRDSYEARINEMARTHEARVNDLERQRANEIDMMRRNSETTHSVSRETHTLRESALMQQLTQLQSERDRMQQQLDIFQAHRTRPVTEQVAELKTMAEQLGLTGGEKEEDWSDKFMDIAKSIGPGISQAIMGKRAQNVQTKEQAARMREAERQHQRRLAAPQHQHQQPQQPGHRPASPTHAPPGGIPSPPSAPPGWGDDPESPAQPFYGGGPMFVHEPAPQEVVGPQPPDVPPNRVMTPMPMTTAPEPEPEPEPTHQPAQHNPAPPPAPAADGGAAPPVEGHEEQGTLASFSPEEAREFLHQLDFAIGAEVDPTSFAEGVIDRIGVERARELVSVMDADTFSTTAGQAGSKRIGTKDGQDFCRALWSYTLARTDPNAAAATADL